MSLQSFFGRFIVLAIVLALAGVTALRAFLPSRGEPHTQAASVIKSPAVSAPATVSAPAPPQPPASPRSVAAVSPEVLSGPLPPFVLPPSHVSHDGRGGLRSAAQAAPMAHPHPAPRARVVLREHVRHLARPGVVAAYAEPPPAIAAYPVPMPPGPRNYGAGSYGMSNYGAGYYYAYVPRYVPRAASVYPGY